MIEASADAAGGGVSRRARGRSARLVLGIVERGGGRGAGRGHGALHAQAAIAIVEHRLFAHEALHAAVELDLLAALGDAGLEGLELAAQLLFVVAQQVGLLEELLGVVAGTNGVERGDLRGRQRLAQRIALAAQLAHLIDQVLADGAV